MNLADLKKGFGAREKVNLWLDHIGETDEVGRAKVLDACANGYEGGTAKEVREFFVSRYESDCVQ